MSTSNKMRTAIGALRRFLDPGDTIYQVKKGKTRYATYFTFVIINKHNGRLKNISELVADALALKADPKRDGAIAVPTDFGEAVPELSAWLFPEGFTATEDYNPNKIRVGTREENAFSALKFEIL